MWAGHPHPICMGKIYSKSRQAFPYFLLFTFYFLLFTFYFLLLHSYLLPHKGVPNRTPLVSKQVLQFILEALALLVILVAGAVLQVADELLLL